MMNPGRPLVWRYSGRMSGVFGQRFGRRKSLTGGLESLGHERFELVAVLRQVKYVYDWLKPARASVWSIAGRVNASARKMASG